MVGNNDMETEQQLKEIGTRLLELPSSIDELLNLLDKLERLLVNVDQAPSIVMQDALLPAMKALISDPLLRNNDADVKVSVASCLCELTRITAPEPPYNDEHMKEIFHLMVAAFEKLSHVSSPSYMKAVSILDTVSKVRSFLIMLDIGLDELIAKMFQQFLKTIRSNHPYAVFVAMETIMTMIINESDEISEGLFSPLLASLKKENQSASPTAWKLGEKVILNSAAKLRPYLKEAVKHEGGAFNEFAPVVASICQGESRTILQDRVNGSGNHLVTKGGLLPDAASPGGALCVVDGMPQSTTNVNASTGNAVNGVNHSIEEQPEVCPLVQHGTSAVAVALCNADHEVELDVEMGTLPRKRGRKPNSLMNPEEGYDHCWNPTGRKETGGLVDGSSPSSDESVPDESFCKRGRPKKQANDMNRDSDPSLRVSKSLQTETMEASLAEYEASLRKLSDGRSKSEVKKQKSTRRIGLSATAATESHPSEKDDILTAPDEKPLHRSTQIRVRNIEKNSDLAETDPRRRSLVMSISNVDSARSRFKKIKSSDRGRNFNGEMPLENPKKKRTPRTEVPLETPDPDDQLIGRNIKVWWPMDKMFYKGVVVSNDPVRRRHKILYADGDVEMLNLKTQKWELIGDDSDSEVQVTRIPKADCSSDPIMRCMIRHKQGKLKVKSEPVELKLNLLRSGAGNISQRKSRRSGNRSAGLVDKAIDDPSRLNWVLEGEGKYPTKKWDAKSKLSAIKSEPTTLDTASPSAGYRDAIEIESPKGTNKSSDVVPSKENAMAEEERAVKPRRDERDEVGSIDSEETL